MIWVILCNRSVQFSHSVLSDSLQPHGVQHTRLLCPSSNPGVCSNSVIPSNHLILCRPLILLPSFFPSIRAFSNESALRIKWPRYWNFSIHPSSEYSGLILQSMDGTLKGLLQHHNLKASILQHSAFFMVQLAHPYMTTK